MADARDRDSRSLRGILGPEQVAGILVGLVLVIGATGYVASGASIVPPGASPSPSVGVASPTPSGAGASPSPTAPGASPSAGASPTPTSSAISGPTLSSMKSLGLLNDRIFVQAPGLSIATTSKPANVLAIKTGCQSVRSTLTSVPSYMTALNSDPSMQALADDLQTAYDTLTSTSQACLDVLARDVPGNVAAANAVLKAIDGLTGPDEALQAAITAAGG